MQEFRSISTSRERRSILKWKDGRNTPCEDFVSTEEPIELRINGVSIAVIMRTPGSDFELAAGFILTEGIIDSYSQIGTISYCDQAEEPNLQNIVDICLSEGIQIDQEKFKRNFYASSSCGICGKASIESINKRIEKLGHSLFVNRHILCGLPDLMRSEQALFSQTGSLHAAALFDCHGALLRLCEDIGRHNAVDKLVGSYAIEGEHFPKKSLMLVSGRTSFEIIQKAASVGIEFVAAVSGPSSLAVDLAKSLNMGLVGFLRPPTFNIYTGFERVVL